MKTESEYQKIINERIQGNIYSHSAISSMLYYSYLDGFEDAQKEALKRAEERLNEI